jgi:hypothetical protein
MAASTALFAQKEVMHIRKVAFEWSAELGFAWPELELQIVDAALNGEFDDPAGKHGFFVKNPETKRAYPRAAAEILSALNGPQFDVNLQWGLENQMYAIHRDALLAFAEKHDLKPPSWWKATAAKSHRKRIGEGVLIKFLFERCRWTENNPPTQESRLRSV